MSAVKQATPRWMTLTSIGLAWLAAASTAGVFILLGGSIDMYRSKTSVDTWALLALAICAALATGFVALSAWFSQRATSSAEVSLRASIVGRLFDRGVLDAKGQHGKLLSLATEAVERTAQYRAGFLGPIIGAMTTPLIVLALMALVDTKIAAWLALLLLVVPLLIGGFQTLVRPIGKQYRESQSALTSAFLESIQALDTLVYARAAQRTAQDLAEHGERHRKSIMRLLAGNQLLILVVDAAFTLAVVVSAAGLSLSRLNAGTLSLGQAVAILLLATLVTGPINVIGQFFYIGIGGRAAQRELNQYLGTQAPGVDAPEAPDASPAPHDGIIFSNVTASWPDAPPVLSGLSFSVAPGEQVALIGPSGIGKSTVSALIQGHLTAQAGEIHVAGQNTATTDPHQLRNQLAVVEQKTFLFVGSVRENLLLARPEASEDELWQALETAGLNEEIRALPKGLDTQVGERGTLLSGGQGQRLGIARAALRQSPIIILDEPTSQVDLAGEAEIVDALARLTAGRTVLMIAHRPGALLKADRVLDLSELLPNSTPDADPAQIEVAP